MSSLSIPEELIISRSTNTRLHQLAQQAWSIVIKLSVLAIHEGNSRGRLERMLALSDRAYLRARRRCKANVVNILQQNRD